MRQSEGTVRRHERAFDHADGGTDIDRHCRDCHRICGGNDGQKVKRYGETAKVLLLRRNGLAGPFGLSRLRDKIGSGKASAGIGVEIRLRAAEKAARRKRE